MTNNPIIVEVTRGDLVESVHRGSAVVCDADGKILYQLGHAESFDGDKKLYPRSALKTYQALAMVMAGAGDFFQFTEQEYAIIQASHNGEPAHTSTVLGILQKIGLAESALECGVHPPYHHATELDLARRGLKPCVLHNNCSGKHAGMLSYAQVKKIPYKNYIDPEHPLQQEILRIIKELCGSEISKPAVDGCSAPTYALPLHNMAYGMAKLAGAKAGSFNVAAKLLLRSAMAQPFYIAGSNRHCSEIMSALPGKVFVKTGAEGFYTAAIPHLGLGVALKTDDGTGRAGEVLITGLLHKIFERDNDAVSLIGLKKLPLEKIIKSCLGIAAGMIRLKSGILSDFPANL